MDNQKTQAKPVIPPGVKPNENDAQYAIDLVKKICSKVGPGLPGSPQEQERASVIKEELESHLGAENVAVEEFTFAPFPFVGSYPICAFLTLINVVAFE